MPGGGRHSGGRDGGGQDRRRPTAAAPPEPCDLPQGPLGIRLPLELGLAGALGRGAGSHLISGSPPAQAATTHLWLRVPSLHQLCPRGGSGRHVSDRVWAQPGGCLHSAPRCALGCPEDGYPRRRQAEGPGHTSCLRYPVAMGPGGTLHLHPQSEDETPGSGLTGAPVSQPRTLSAPGEVQTGEAACVSRGVLDSLGTCSEPGLGGPGRGDSRGLRVRAERVKQTHVALDSNPESKVNAHEPPLV